MRQTEHLRSSAICLISSTSFDRSEETEIKKRAAILWVSGLRLVLFCHKSSGLKMMHDELGEIIYLGL